jgi:flagellar basal-body rod protein FlgC
MSFLDALQTSASGLSAQRLRMNLISSNLANVNTTRTEDGGPYRRKDPIFKATEAQTQFRDRLNTKMVNTKMANANVGVQVTEIRDDYRPPILKFDPGHPDADENGYIALPNINVLEEMVNMISATRSYEANVTAIKATKDMASDAMDIGR